MKNFIISLISSFAYSAQILRQGQEGDFCGGWDESNSAPYPDCASGLVCIDSGAMSIGGGASNQCVQEQVELICEDYDYECYCDEYDYCIDEYTVEDEGFYVHVT